MEQMANLNGSICQSDTLTLEYDPSCTGHPTDPGTPACTGGGHCVDNISISRRPTRRDMLDWLKSRPAV